MARRRLIRLALVLVAVVAAVSAWWLSPAPLSAEEELLVGTWVHVVSPPNDFWPAGGTIFCRYARDRTCRVYGIDGRTGERRRDPSGELSEMRGRWRVTDGKLVFDRDAGLVDRVRRMLPATWPWALAPTQGGQTIERPTPDEFILDGETGKPLRFTRTQAD